jgi:serine/threonine protein kinase
MCNTHHFEGYTFLNVLASGDGTHLYKAIDANHNSVVIKVPRFANSTQSEHSQLSQITHQSIIPLLDSIDTVFGPALVFPFAEGDDLFNSAIVNHSLDEQSLKLVFYHILSALAHLHRSGRMHRDIKPENILLSDASPDSAVLADFGAACTIERACLDPAFPGTQCYAAPEVWSGRPYNEKVDVWAVGVSAYVTVAKCFPFLAPVGSLEMADEIVGGLRNAVRIRQFLDASKEFQEFIEAMLTVDIEMRPTAEEAMEFAWFGELRNGKGGRMRGMEVDVGEVPSI